jgi:hypothetical protein
MIGEMVRRALVLTACFCSFMVTASYVLFARDQLAGASRQQQAQLAAVAPGTPPPAHHGKRQPRKLIDGVSATLTKPFESIAHSNSAWANHTVPALFALLVFGTGLGFAARYTSGRA